MSIPDQPIPLEKKQHTDHPPVVVGSRRQAIVFCVIVIVLALSPLMMGFQIKWLIPPSPDLDWILAIDSRTAASAETIHQRKIVFIGGSNLRLGLNTALLTRDLGMPVVNYGLHAGLGVDVIAARAITCVKPGDIVVFAPELSNFRKNGIAESNDNLRIDFLGEHPSEIDPSLQSFPKREWFRARNRCNQLRIMLENSRSTLEKAMGIRLTKTNPGQSAAAEISPYTLDGLGPDGSIIAPRPGPKPYDTWSVSGRLEPVDLIDSRGGVAFFLLKKACADRHCALCVMPPIRLEIPQFDQAKLLSLEQDFLDMAVKNGAIEVMKPGDTVLPREDGYDTDYHLNDKGVAIMEPKIAAAMKAFLQRKDFQSP